MTDMMNEETESCAIVDAAAALKPFVVRLEWASTIAYCDVAVMARDFDHACMVAYEEVDYDTQDNYDDGGETYVSCVAECESQDDAEGIADNRDAWSQEAESNVPTKHASDGEKLSALRDILGRLIEWDAFMGNHEDPRWTEARALYEGAR